MKLFGRIILFVISVSLLGSAFSIFRENWIYLSQEGWTDFSTYPARVTALSAIVGQIINFLFGIIALIGAIRGKMSLKLLIATILMILPVIWYFYNINIDGTIEDVYVVAQAVIEFVLPIGYFIGAISLLKRK